MEQPESKLAYLACPYSHPDPSVRAIRYRLVNRVLFELITKGKLVYSPLTHNMPLNQMGIHGNWETWRRFDHEMVSRCDYLLVLRLPGWENSKGVAAEVECAKELGKPIEYIDAPDSMIEYVKETQA